LRAERKKRAADRDGKRGVFGLRAWVKEWFSPYRGVDYRGFIEEYKKLVEVVRGTREMSTSNSRIRG
jgi:hypothetical protein